MISMIYNTKGDFILLKKYTTILQGLERLFRIQLSQLGLHIYNILQTSLFIVQSFQYTTHIVLTCFNSIEIKFVEKVCIRNLQPGTLVVRAVEVNDSFLS